MLEWNVKDVEITRHILFILITLNATFCIFPKSALLSRIVRQTSFFLVPIKLFLDFSLSCYIRIEAFLEGIIELK